MALRPATQFVRSVMSLLGAFVNALTLGDLFLAIVVVYNAAFHVVAWPWVMVPFAFSVGVGFGRAASHRSLASAALQIETVKRDIEARLKRQEARDAVEASRKWILHPGRRVRVNYLSAAALCVDVKPKFVAGRRRGAEGVMIGETVGGAWLVKYDNGDLCVHLPSELESALIVTPPGLRPLSASGL